MSGLHDRWHWNLLPTTVLLMGALSVALLLWAYRVNGKERNSSDIVDAIGGIQIHAATGHLSEIQSCSDFPPFNTNGKRGIYSGEKDIIAALNLVR